MLKPFKILFLIELLLLPILWGCTSSKNDSLTSTQSSSNLDENLLEEGIMDVIDLHLEVSDPKTLVERALKGVIQQSSSLNIITYKNAILLEKNHQFLARFTSPYSQDTEEWVNFANTIIAKARQSDPQLSAMSQDSLHKVFFNTILKSLDPYSRYVDPFEANVNRLMREGNNLGILISKNPTGIVIAALIAQGSAVNAGLKKEDYIIAINGKSLHALDIPQIYQLLYDPSLNPLSLTIQRDHSTPFEITIDQSYHKNTSVKVFVQDKILYIKITNFNELTVPLILDQTTSIITSMQQDLEGVVLDLRSNPGGLLLSAVEVADLFLDQGVITIVKGRNPQSYQFFEATKGDHFLRLPTVVIINGRSASAAEILTAALKDNKRAIIIGSTSYGKGTVQTIPSLSNNAEISITWANFYSPNGDPINIKGIIPNLCSHDIVETTIDKQLEGYYLQKKLPNVPCAKSTAVRNIEELIAAKLIKSGIFAQLLLR